MSIQLAELTKRFGDNLVVNRVNLSIQRGELFVLLGGSGSGKSTILRLIAGLSQPDSGRIDLEGRDVTDLPPQARGTGFVFQNYSIFRHMTVVENVEFGLRIRRVPPADRRRRSDELLELVGLSGLGARYTDQLSGGQQQRVALARALAYHPNVLLLDEPFGALDVKIRAQLRRSLKDIQRQLRVTTILVTHDQEEAFELADRIGVIDRGHIIETGTPEALYHHPRTEYVATFIGGGNVLVGYEEGGQIRLGSNWLPMPDSAGPQEPGVPVRVLFRPETVVLEDRPSTAGSGSLPLGPARIVDHIFKGALERIVLEVDSLRGARPLAPPHVFGQRAPRIEAVLPSRARLGDPHDVRNTGWVSLRGYHVLAPTGLKILVCVTGSPFGLAAAEIGSQLALAARGPTTLLGIANAAGEVPQVREHLDAMRRQWFGELAQLDISVRHGHHAAELSLAAREGLYEVVIVGRPSQSTAVGGAEISAAARQVLSQLQIPVLLVQEPRPAIRRILICTAGGEPGKADVRFGGRLARRMGASVTLLHAHLPSLTSKARARLERHLRQGQATLESLGIESTVKIEAGAAVETILSEADAGEADLIVIGAPAPRAPQQSIWRDLSIQVVGGTARPVLIVPMME